MKTRLGKFSASTAHWLVPLIFTITSLAAVGSCSDDDPTICPSPGAIRSCSCPGGGTGTQTCYDDIGWGTCENCPTTCETCVSLGAECGSWPDGCGGTINCGTCQNGTCDAWGQCIVDSCGNGSVDFGEDCDGANLNNASCTTIGMGFTSGTLSCTSSCTFNTNGCVSGPSCGDDQCEAGEDCVSCAQDCCDGWTCNTGWYDASDGCDCGCSIADPDCAGAGCSQPGCQDSDCDFCWDAGGQQISCDIPVCGDGNIDPGETCDPPSTCPTSCDDGNSCTADSMSGSAATCDAACSNTPITSCTSNDGCCPGGCTGSNDNDCVGCGNGVCDGSETCTSCPQDCGAGVCTPGTPQTQACGNCGTRTRTCTSSCTWGSWSSCTGQGVCSPGSTQNCSNACGSGTETCSASCQWGSCSAPTSAQIIIGVTKDTYVDAGSPNTNFGSELFMYAGVESSGDVVSALLYFPISSLPSASVTTLTSAELIVKRLESTPAGGGFFVKLGRALSTWSENTVNWWSRPNVSALSDVAILCTTWICAEEFDITSYVNHIWQLSDWSNHGLALWELYPDPGYYYSISSREHFLVHPVARVSFTCP